MSQIGSMPTGSSYPATHGGHQDIKTPENRARSHSHSCAYGLQWNLILEEMAIWLKTPDISSHKHRILDEKDSV